MGVEEPPPPPPPPPSPCDPILQEIRGLREERARVQADLPGSPDKSVITKQINQINADISKKEAEYRKCMGIKSPPIGSPGTSLSTTLFGTATFASNSAYCPAPTPVSVQIPFVFEFTNSRIANVLMFFPKLSLIGSSCSFIWIKTCPLTIDVEVPGGLASGTYDTNTDEINIPLSFKLTPLTTGIVCNSAPLIKSTTLSLNSPGLTTQSVFSPVFGTTLFGSPVNKTQGPNYGNVALVGAGAVAGGIVFGASAQVTIMGTLSGL